MRFLSSNALSTATNEVMLIIIINYYPDFLKIVKENICRVSRLVT